MYFPRQVSNEDNFDFMIKEFVWQSWVGRSDVVAKSNLSFLNIHVHTLTSSREHFHRHISESFITIILDHTLLSGRCYSNDHYKNATDVFQYPKQYSSWWNPDVLEPSGSLLILDGNKIHPKKIPIGSLVVFHFISFVTFFFSVCFYCVIILSLDFRLRRFVFWIFAWSLDQLIFKTSAVCLILLVNSLYPMIA